MDTELIDHRPDPELLANDSDSEDEFDFDLSDASANAAVPSEAGSTAPGRASRPSPNRALVRRAIAKFTDLTAAPSDELAILAVVLGVPADPAELAVTVVTYGRANLRVLDKVEQLAAEPDPFDAMAAAMELEASEQRRVWDVLTSLGATDGKLPGKDAAAAKAIARAAVALTSSHQDTLGRVRVLARK